MKDPFVKLRLTDAISVRDSMPGWSTLPQGLALARAIDAAEALVARKKARPLKQQHEKPSKLNRLRKAHGKRGARARKTMEVYGAVEQRAGGVCECGCSLPFDQTMGGAPEMDHFWGRGATGDKAESVETCWMLRREHHRSKTDNKPGRGVWLLTFRRHAQLRGYARQAELATQELDAAEAVSAAWRMSHG